MILPHFPLSGQTDLNHQKGHSRILAGTIEDNLKYNNACLQIGVPPSRHDFDTIVLLTEGTCQQNVGLHTYLLKPKDLIIIPENNISYTTSLSNTKGFYVQFTGESLISFINSHTIEETFSFLDIDANYLLSLNDVECELLKYHFHELINACNIDTLEKENLVKSYLYILLLKLNELYSCYFGSNKSVSTRAQVITKQYKLLVEKHFLSKRSVPDYAELMCITSKHLADVLKQTIGKTPSDLIQEMILLEAKVLLQQTDMTITQIAHHLNFDDQSYFSRFFKKHTSQSPVEYRKHH